MDLGKLNVSNGSGEAIRSLVTVLRLPGATVITVDSLTNWPTDFVATTGPLLANGTLDPTKTIVFRGHISGSTIVIDALAPGYTDTYGNAVGDVVVIKPATWWADTLVDKVQTSINDDGTLKKTAIETALGGDSYKQGWRTDLPAVNSITNNGQGSYDVTFASTVAALLSPGQRFMGQRTTAAPTYMSSNLNGSSQYFIKTTPTSSLSTLTNNFTIMATVMPTVESQPDATFISRADSGVGNIIEIWRLITGQVRILVANGGSANYRYVTTHSSLPTNRKTHVAVTWASGTVVIYFDGKPVPIQAAVTSGTAPTAAGTGGDFAVGRRGASSSAYFAGRVSNVGVFNAVLSQATILSLMGQVLTGAETNCIGAWSLNNTAVNQQAPGTNDLTAQGGATYTSGVSPFATNGAGVSTGTYEFGLVHKVNGAVATIQVPEGCALPTTGGLTAAFYSADRTPFNFPGDKNRWVIQAELTSSMNTAGTTINTVYNPGGFYLDSPIGKWKLKTRLLSQTTNSANLNDVIIGVSTSTSAFSNYALSVRDYVYQGAVTFRIWWMYAEEDIETTVATKFYTLYRSQSGFTQADIRGENQVGYGSSYIRLENAYL